MVIESKKVCLRVVESPRAAPSACSRNVYVQIVKLLAKPSRADIINHPPHSTFQPNSAPSVAPASVPRVSNGLHMQFVALGKTGRIHIRIGLLVGYRKRNIFDNPKANVPPILARCALEIRTRLDPQL